MDEVADTQMLDDAADKIAAVTHSVDVKARDGGQAVDAVGAVVAEYLACIPAEPDEVELLLSYAREAIAQIAAEVGDPVLEEYGEEVFVAGHMGPHVRAHLELMLERIEVAIHLGDEGSVDELVDLCRRGRHTHNNLLGLAEAGHRVISLAHDLGRPDALAAAVRPTPDGAARIGHHYWFRGECLHALDSLAHLAAEPGSATGNQARSELVALVGYIDTAGEAAVRLPLHLLTDDDRAKLLGFHESRVELFTNDPVPTPVHLSLLRDNRIVRTALWQAIDASHT